jgi:hypothetical protein
MAEYIEREAFLDYMKGTSRYFNVKFDIENFPAADVEPVVHCRDCKYQTKRWHSDKRFRHGGYYFYGCDNMENSNLGQDNDFCARGERKIT